MYSISEVKTVCARSVLKSENLSQGKEKKKKEKRPLGFSLLHRFCLLHVFYHLDVFQKELIALSSPTVWP